jgi:hypothetical protein
MVCMLTTCGHCVALISFYAIVHLLSVKYIPALFLAIIFSKLHKVEHPYNIEEHITETVWSLLCKLRVTFKLQRLRS